MAAKSSGRYRQPVDPLVRISKSLSSLLRHRAEKEGFKLLPGGFLYLDDVLKHRHFNGVTAEEVQTIVETNDKQRFSIKTEEETGRLMIRANQGHSMEVQDLELQPINDASDYPVVIHGTYEKCYKSIAQEGLKRMGRNHIHFAAGEPGQNGVISGMRQTCSIVIYLNLHKALQDGLQFYLSANNVILSPGDEDGLISPEYFSKVKNKKSGKELPVHSKHTIHTNKSEKISVATHREASPPHEAQPVGSSHPEMDCTSQPSPEISSHPEPSAVTIQNVMPEDLADEIESGRRRNRKKNKKKKGLEEDA